MTREEAKHIDAFKYWCETNEENGVITIPKFICDHIVEILDDTNARPRGEWIESKSGLPTNHHYCSNCNEAIRKSDYQNFCPNCGADMRKRGDEK